MDTQGGPSSGDKSPKRSWWVAGGAMLWLLTIGKNLIGVLKLSKFAAPVISMLITLGTYALVFPFAFSIGLVSMILIHELGHVWAAKRKGLPVSAPLFIPFLGAFIALKRSPRDAVTEAYIAICGPLFGTIGASVAFGLGWYTREPVFLVAAYLGFFLNLINLLPIHPLDGGRIATAVTRWLWLVGLVGGVAVIYYMQSLLFFIIWLWFAWSLGSKYVWKRKGQVFAFPFQIEMETAPLVAYGIMLPGTEHRRELAFDTFSSLDGQQKVIVHWEAMGIGQTLLLPQQCLIDRVQVTRIEYTPEAAPERMIIHGRVEHRAYKNDRYYEVPPATRWKFGIAYGVLAAVLITMMIAVQRLEYWMNV